MALSPLALVSSLTAASRSAAEPHVAAASGLEASLALSDPGNVLARDPAKDVSAGPVFSRRQAHSRKYDPWKDIYVQGGFSPSPADTSHEPSAATEETRRRSGDYYDYVEDTADYYDPYSDVTYTNSADDDSSSKQEGTDRVDRPRPPVFIGPQNRPNDYESSLQPPQQQQSLLRRMSNALRAQTGLAAVVAIAGGLFVLGAAYWLFVVNGPTPVVKARNEEGDSGHDAAETLSLVTAALLQILAGPSHD